jgi:hypothetical protein
MSVISLSGAYQAEGNNCGVSVLLNENVSLCRPSPDRRVWEQAPNRTSFMILSFTRRRLPRPCIDNVLAQKAIVHWRRRYEMLGRLIVCRVSYSPASGAANGAFGRRRRGPAQSLRVRMKIAIHAILLDCLFPSKLSFLLSNTFLNKQMGSVRKFLIGIVCIRERLS